MMEIPVSVFDTSALGATCIDSAAGTRTWSAAERAPSTDRARKMKEVGFIVRLVNDARPDEMNDSCLTAMMRSCTIGEP